MARIRSIHPGLFTDEAFVAVSPLARVLLLGIWTEADDHGVFDWKPLTLKMRILPIDNVDIAALLGELEAVHAIAKVTFGGKDRGLVRNFCRYQRPKRPTYRVALPNEYWNYIGLQPDGSVPSENTSPNPPPHVPHTSPTPHPQGENKQGNVSAEGGGRRRKKEEGKEEEERKKETRASALLPEFETFWFMWPHKVGKPAALKAFRSAITRAVSLEAILNGVEVYSRDKPADRPWLNPATYLNQDRWKDQPATVSMTNGKPRNGIIQAADDLVRKIAEFDGPPREPDELRSETGQTVVRLLPNGRRQ